jgi:hypothetical protein
MKRCPYCLVEIHEATIVCPNCNSDLMITVPIGVVAKQNVWEHVRKRNSFIAHIIFGVVIALFIACAVGSFIVLWNSY